VNFYLNPDGGYLSPSEACQSGNCIPISPYGAPYGILAGTCPNPFVCQGEICSFTENFQLPKKNNSILVVIIIIILLFLLVSGYFFYSNMSSTKTV
jgi:hypothetical protein